MASRNSGGKLMMAGLIIAFIGLCIVLVRVFGVPDWGVLLVAGVGLIVLGLIRRFTSSPDSR